MKKQVSMEACLRNDATTGDGKKVRAGLSANMSAIRSKNTKPERLLRAALRGAFLTGYRCHLKCLPGRPDLAYTRWKIAIFVDGAYWHGHPDHFKPGKFGRYWDEKIERTKLRDQLGKSALEGMGYLVLRFWDFQVLKSPDVCVAEVAEALNARGKFNKTTRPYIAAVR